jgi:hypothetical protein
MTFMSNHALANVKNLHFNRDVRLIYFGIPPSIKYCKV